MPTFLSVDEIRRRWIAFFVAEGHKHVPSASLLPHNDPSVLFTGAGMNQFKDNFMGRAKLDHPRQRAVTVQKVMRASDIDNVGRTPNHQTFFEMLGHFSFGDYFKKESIAFNWRFLTDPEIGLGLAKERISVTIFGGDAALGIPKDIEAMDAWKATAPELQNKDGSWRIYEYGQDENFWPANAPSEGPNGPCGPNSEMFYDVKPEQGAPEPVGSSRDKYRYPEFGNQVFTQFNRVDVGKLEPLSQKNIDMGGGLERMARIVQGKSTNFETDLLFPIVQEVARLSKKTYGQEFELDRRMRRITDHTRAAVFCIADGIAPKNEGRNYVVRRLMRRAILDGRELGITDPFLGAVARVVVKQMSVGYPELLPRTDTLIRLIEEEEAAFSRTLASGSARLDEALMVSLFAHLQNEPTSDLHRIFPVASRLAKKHLFSTGIDQETGEAFLKLLSDTYETDKVNEVIKSQKEIQNHLLNEWHEKKGLIAKSDVHPTVHGCAAFRMWDTYGFPLELTEEHASSSGFAIDRAGYDRAYQEAIDRSKANSGMPKEIFAGGPVAELKTKFAGKKTEFEGYGNLLVRDAKVLALIQNDKLVEYAAPGEAVVLFDRTPFYGESGGQVGDCGAVIAGKTNTADVIDTQKTEGLVLHRVKIRSAMRIGDTFTLEVDAQHRLPTLKNHSATHLLHNALRGILGSHVEQRGSLVAPDRLRFDFTHFEQIKPEQLADIEARVNQMIVSDFPVDTQEMAIAEAKTKGAMALFGEKYGDRVRVVSMGPSVELCGGTHCVRTGEIGYFRIVSENSVAAGVRRIEALTGAAAVADARKTDELLGRLALQLKTKKELVFERFAALQAETAALVRELESARKKAANAAAGDLLSNVKEIAGGKILIAPVEGADAATLRTTLDGIRKNFKDGAVVLGGAKDGKVALLVSVPPELVQRGLHAGNLLKEVAPIVGGKGGGKPEMAQGGGTETARLGEALDSVAEIVKILLSK